MDEAHRDLFEDLLTTPAPSGHEATLQRRWLDAVEPHADETRVDAYGNAVAIAEGNPETDATVAVTGHADEIGFAVRDVTDDGFLELASLGAADQTVSRGQHVTVHTEGGPVPGVVGQTAIHLRDGESEVAPIAEQFVDIGAADGERARELVSVGDPMTVVANPRDLDGSLLAARNVDNRAGVWVAAAAFQRAAAAGTSATVVAISTVQEEVGLRGARMVGVDLDADAVLAVDVTHATDSPGIPEAALMGVELGGGPVLHRGTTDHPNVVAAAREVAEDADIDVQLAAAPVGTRTDADEFSAVAGGTPTLSLGVPNRYMHTPVETVDLDDLAATADLAGAFCARAEAFVPFGVEV
ncbi:MAG: M20/M25/M40 family metallo-hydrolase [Haloglomus sp.]